MKITLDAIRNVKIYQSESGYRFSVDALLLYSFVKVRDARYIADIGAGSGIIGLLLANKYRNAKVTLFELQDNLAAFAEKNISLNLLENRVSLVKTDIRELKNCPSPMAKPQHYDIAVSNPPFKKIRSGLISPDEERAIARHEVKLNIPEFAGAANYLLKPKGKFFLVFHPERLTELMAELEKKMAVKRLKFVHPSTASEATMVLVEAVKDCRHGLKVDRPLFIRNEKGLYTEEMHELCYGTQ